MSAPAASSIRSCTDTLRARKARAMSLSPDAARMKRDLADLVAIARKIRPAGRRRGRAIPGAACADHGLALTSRSTSTSRVGSMSWRGSRTAPGRCSPSTRIWMSCRRATGGRRPVRAAGGGQGGSTAAAPATARARWLPCWRPCACLTAARAYWRGTVLGVFVADEEIASEGAKHYAATAPKIDSLSSASRPRTRLWSRTRAACGRWCASTACRRIPARRISARTPSIVPASFSAWLRSITRWIVRQRTHPLVGGQA